VLACWVSHVGAGGSIGAAGYLCRADATLTGRGWNLRMRPVRRAANSTLRNSNDLAAGAKKNAGVYGTSRYLLRGSKRLKPARPKTPTELCCQLIVADQLPRAYSVRVAIQKSEASRWLVRYA
jgi:hypothetical protein